MIRKLYNWYLRRKTDNAIVAGEFGHAVNLVKKISDYSDQEEATYYGLFFYAMKRMHNNDSEFTIVVTRDKDEYEKFRSIVGVANSKRILVYHDEISDLISGESIKTAVDLMIEPDNPLLKFLKQNNSGEVATK